MRVFLFDADGVLTVPEELFSHIYAKSHGLDIEPFEQFFKNAFPDALIGAADLKELIRTYADLWQHGDPDEILRIWLKTEDIKNEEALEIVRKLRESGAKCYLATNQEKYRGAYMKDIMFKDLFDDYFISGEMGVKKPSGEFFQTVLAKIQKDVSDIQPENIVFFDDTPAHVEGARAAGLDAHLYQNIKQLRLLV